MLLNSIDALFEEPLKVLPPRDMEREAHAKILRWRNDPEAFVREVFGADPDTWQVEALNNIGNNDRVSIKSGHGVGKSALLSWLLIWWLSTRYPAKVACTAPSSHQLYDVLWAEVRYWLRKAIPEIASQFVLKSDMIELVGGASETFAVARTSRKESPDSLQGFHSPNMLFLVDECSGVPDVIFQVASGAMSTVGAKQMLTGNPTRATGYFAKSHDIDSNFVKMTVSSETAKMVSPGWIQEMKDDWGEDSEVYRIRVLGEFPKSDSEALIPLDLVLEATERNIIQPLEKPIWGLDVARYGMDRSVLMQRRTHAVTDEPDIWSGLSTMELVGRVVNKYNNLNERDRPSQIFVDVIGIGAGVTDRLIEMGLPAVGINVSESPMLLADNVFRLRDELWMQALKWLETRAVQIINCPPLIKELTSVHKGYTSSGKMRIESKDDTKKRVGRSPDLADAFVLTFSYGAGLAQGAFSSRHSDWSIPINREAAGNYV